jgi:hypothetical protein
MKQEADSKFDVSFQSRDFKSDLDEKDLPISSDSKIKNDHNLYEDSKNESNLSLIEKVQDYFFGSDTLAKTFEDFIQKRCHIVDLDDEEYKLEYTKVFEEYKTLFEDSMESYIKAKQDYLTYLNK